jgi:hypothetical protein
VRPTHSDENGGNVNEFADEKPARLPRCPNHARRAPVATVVVGARSYCPPCAEGHLTFLAHLAAISVKQQITND